MTSPTPAFGPYRLDRLLGRGGMGEVYRAYDDEHRRVVALKILAPGLADDREYQERFRREAYSAAQLRSPHIVPIHRYGTIAGRLYIDMRMVDGGDLGELIAAEAPLAPERAVGMLAQVASALDEAHASRLVHRDVKPANVLLDASVPDFCYLTDFGVTRTASTVQSHTLTRAGALVGSLSYMAPEQFRGAVTTRSDVYALGCVFFEMLTGRKPYGGDDLPALMHAHMSAPPPRPSDIVPGAAMFDEVVAGGMAKDADLRFASAGELARAAQEALRTQQHNETMAAVPGPPAPPGPTRTDDRATAPVSAVAAPVGGGGAAVSAAGGAGAAVSSAGGAGAAATPAGAAGERPPVGAAARRPWLVPLAAVTVVLVLVAGTWAAVANRAGMPGQPQAAPTTAATAAPTSAPAPPAVPNGAVITEAFFTGRTSNSPVSVAVGYRNGKAAGYLCDGNDVEAWLEGTIVGDRVSLHGKPGTDTALTATAGPRSLLGSLQLNGREIAFSASSVVDIHGLNPKRAGLYQFKGPVKGITARIGWIVLPDGSQVGILNANGAREKAPALDIANLTADGGGVPVTASPVLGDATVLG